MLSDIIKQKEKLNIFIIIESLLCAGIVYTTCTVRPNITSLLFALSFIVLLFEFLKYLLNDVDRRGIDFLLISIILFSGFNVIVNAINAEATLNFEYLKTYFIFVSTIILYRLALNIKLNKKTVDYIFAIQIVISLIYIYAKNFVPQTEGITTQKLLSLNFSNPNLTGMFLLQSLLFMSIGIFYFRNILLKVFCGILAVILFDYTLKTEARNAIIAYVMFLIISLLFIFKRDFKLPKWFLVVINIAPIVFVPIYLAYIDVIEKSGKLDFLTSEGKSLYSRVGVWNGFFEKFNNSWFLGSYSNCKGNSHNAQLVVLFSYGLFVLILVIWFNYYISLEINKKTENRFSGISIAAFLSIIFMQLGEGAIYSGGVGLYIFSGIFIMLANSDILFNNKKINF